MSLSFRSFKTVPTIEHIRKEYPLVKALLFDMDGTLFDTEKIHAQALINLASFYKITPPLEMEPLYELMVGKADHLLFEIIKSWEGIPSHWDSQAFILEKNFHLLELLRTIPAESYFAKPVQFLLNEAKTQQFFLGLVTSSEKIITDYLLSQTGLNNYFHLTLTRDDCLKHKPDPFPYLKAQEICGLNSDEIIIFEDSQVGLQAAKASGAKVIKVEWYQSKLG